MGSNVRRTTGFVLSLKNLFSLDAGLADLRKIIAQAPHLLAKDGKIFLEHGASQANLVRASMKKNNFTNVQSYHDLRLEELPLVNKYFKIRRIS